MKLISYDENRREDIISFIKQCYIPLGYSLDIDGKDKDLQYINEVYTETGGQFWLLIDETNTIHGSIGLRIIADRQVKIGEVCRFYVAPESQHLGYGTMLLKTVYSYATNISVNFLRGTTREICGNAIKLFEELGAYRIPQYRESNSSLFYEIAVVPIEFENQCSQMRLFAKDLRESIIHISKEVSHKLILNPVENFPSESILYPCSSNLHGLYNTDSMKTTAQKKEAKILFAGRDEITADVNQIYSKWAELLNAEALSMRFLSGLHAHIIVFMALTSIGDSVLLLSEEAGGHMSTHAILERLGLIVYNFPIDYTDQRVDREASLELIRSIKPKLIFVDRSEGLIYEDFSWLNNVCGTYKIFDASQYLTNIIARDYQNPFDMGFDMIISTMHKNLPGPQRALVCCKKCDSWWLKLKSGTSQYVSNMHFSSIYSAGLLLDELEKLYKLSNQMLKNTLHLDHALEEQGFSTIPRKNTQIEPNTHHIWIKCNSPEEAYNWYLKLQEVGILVNYRKLPYNIGYGLRLGLSAATYCGLDYRYINQLARLCWLACSNGYCEEYNISLELLLKQIQRIT